MDKNSYEATDNMVNVPYVYDVPRAAVKVDSLNQYRELENAIALYESLIDQLAPILSPITVSENGPDKHSVPDEPVKELPRLTPMAQRLGEDTDKLAVLNRRLKRIINSISL